MSLFEHLLTVALVVCMIGAVLFFVWWSGLER
jgi:hypothetical protein